MLAPAAKAFALFSSVVNTASLDSFPNPEGITHYPLTTWSPCLGSTLSLMHKSTV